MILIEKIIFYSENAGLFDEVFTKIDITQCIVIFIGSTLRARYEWTKDGVKNPNFIDIIFMYLIAYFICGLVFYGIIYKGLNPTLGYIINGGVSTQALTIMNWIQDEKTQNMIKETLGGLFPIVKKLYEKWTK